MTSRVIWHLYTYFILETSVLISRVVALDCILTSSIQMAFSRLLPAFVGICFLFLLSEHYLDLSFGSSTHDYNALWLFASSSSLIFCSSLSTSPPPSSRKFISHSHSVYLFCDLLSVSGVVSVTMSFELSLVSHASPVSTEGSDCPFPKCVSSQPFSREAWILMRASLTPT